jgi:NADPH:quinone reductase-like Zn-dependent oxidoreductase
MREERAYERHRERTLERHVLDVEALTAEEACVLRPQHPVAEDAHEPTLYGHDLHVAELDGKTAVVTGGDGKTAVVTGGAISIGRAVVRALNEAGAQVAVADIDKEGGRSVAEELGERVIFVPTESTSSSTSRARISTRGSLRRARFGSSPWT